MMRFWSGGHWEPYEFWEYTTIVTDRFYELESGFGDDGSQLRGQMQSFEEELVQHFRKVGINAHADNKIAFGLKNKETGQVVYIGFKDWGMAIGSSVRHDTWLKPIRKGGEE